MTVIIRLQNLPWTANALDIRRFFQGLSIPDGGVHIVGGDKGDAFIAFNTDDDARQAMYRDNSRISDSPVKLMLSSKSEMQNVIAVARGTGTTPSGTSNQQRPSQMSGSSGPQIGPQGGMAPGMKSGMSGPNMGPAQQQVGGFSGEPKRDGRSGDIGGFNNQGQGQFESHSSERLGSGPDQMGGGPDRMGGSDRMGGGPDRMGGGPDRMGGGPDRMGGGPDRMGGSDRMGGGPDRMGGSDRMGGGPDRMGGGPDRMGGSDRMGGGHDRMGGGPDRMGGGPDRMGGGPDRMGGSDRMGGGPDRMGGGPDRMGGAPDRMGGGPDRMGGSDRMGGGPDRMGGDPDRMGGGPDRMGGGPDRMGGSDRMGGGPDRMGGGPDRMGGDPDRMGGGPDRMGGSDRMGGGPDRTGGNYDRIGGGSDRMGGPDRMIGGPDRMEPDHMGGYDRGGNMDRMIGPDMSDRMGGPGSIHESDQMSGRMGGNDFTGGFVRMENPDNMGGFNRMDGRMGGNDGPGSMDLSRTDNFGDQGLSNRGDHMGGQNQFGDIDRQDRFRGPDLDRRDSFSGNRRDMEERPMGGGFGQDQDWSRRNDNNRPDENFMGGDRDRRGDHGFNDFRDTDNFGRGNQMDMDKDIRGDFNNDMPPQENFNQGGINRDEMRNNRDNFGPGGNQGFGGNFGGNRMESNSGNDNFDKHRGGSDFDRGNFSRSSMRDRMSPERSFRGGRGGFSSRGGLRGDVSRKRGHDSMVYVVISNMPTTANYREVRRFFSGMEIPREGMKLINDKYGERIGEGYIMFSKDVDGNEVLNKSGYLMGHKKVNVRKCSARDFENAIDSYVPRGTRPMSSGGPPAKRNRSRSPAPKSHPDSNCIVMKNVHFNAHKDDVKKLLGHLKIKHNGPFMETMNGRPSGTAYAELENKKDQEAALDAHKKLLMGRTVEIYSIAKSEFNIKTRNSEPKDIGDKRLVEIKSEEKDVKEKPKEVKSGKSENSSKDEDRKLYCVRMRGLPFSATPETIGEFFSGFEVVNRGIHLVYTRQHQAAGVAFVEFVASADCKKAVAKDKEFIGKRYINIAAITKKEMLEQMSDEQRRQNGAGSGSMGGSNHGGKTDTLALSNLPFKVQLEDIMQFFRGYRAIQDSVRLRYSKDGKPMGDAMVSFSNPNEAQRAVKELNRKQIFGRQIFLDPLAK